SEYNRAEVNGYLHANVVRDYTLTYNPQFNTIWNQHQFPVNVNIADDCNAYYDYSSINFFTSGGGCANSAFSTVVHHEYGHHLVSVAGSGQGQYGEGFGDVMGILIMDEAELGWGFFNNCNDYMRTGDNTFQYPCSGEIHYCGQLISGCVWSLRNELLSSYPLEYRDILGGLAVNSILMHQGTMITPEITIHYLTLDDDDEFIENGTPHWEEICAAFNAHNMDCPEIIPGVYISHTPLEDTPSTNPYEVNADIISSLGSINSATVHYSTDNVNFTSVDMQDMGGNSYRAYIPGQQPCTFVYYYIEAGDNSGNSGRRPETGSYRFFVGSEFITLFADNFQTNTGWTVSGNALDGQWQRAVPAGGGDRGDPPSDSDGSGYCYVTDNADGNSDVDDGTTVLTSPTLDLSNADSKISYARWYSNSEGDNPLSDIFEVYISGDNGSTWVLAETVGPVEESSGGWYQHSFWVADYISPSVQGKIRFQASDLGGGSIVEAGVDDFKISRPDCTPLPTGTLEGTVSDNSSNPILNANVFADDGLGHTGSANTDGSGFYTLDLIPGTYEVSFSHPNYINIVIPDVVITEGGTTVQDAVLEEDTTEVPTLSEWGMLIMALLLLTFGTVAVIWRRKRSAEGNIA
ncbi:MAG: IPTL-CTERM sorting domain-containing protein, partial [candidate division Zixibacteria bacterium]